ncbi:MAG: [protein-PII] uridylyltransferase [Myxococcales bacterium]|nr:[protein-PII] uridylyltransferase [Myxococcales bacterium]
MSEFYGSHGCPDTLDQLHGVVKAVVCTGRFFVTLVPMSAPSTPAQLANGAERIDRARAQMAVDLAEGMSGACACRRLSESYDALVNELWDHAMADLPAARDAGFSLVALGGWGREEICPFSDIDFVLLAEAGQEDLAKELADKILYPLWDAKVKVGHAVRNSAAAAALARDDLPTATALLDARLVVGDSATFLPLVTGTRQSVAPGGNANAFLRMLSDERERRYERFGDSLYLLEPNIKQGIGGLRDHQTAHWAARARWSVKSLADLVAIGELTRRQLEVMERGLDFLLRLRSLVQLEAGRSTDQLSFEIQESIGPRLFPYVVAPKGRVVPAVAPAVETLMRKYYLAGRGIERVTNRLIESAIVPARRKPHIHKIDHSFLSWNGKLAVRDPSIFAEQPAEMFRYFRVALEHGLPLYGHTQELIEAQIASSGHVLSGDPLAGGYFLDALVDLRDLSSDRQHAKSLLRQMHALGLLAALMPEFGPCTGRVQHDLYHVYTVDQHQLAAVGLLKKTGAGQLGMDGRGAMDAYQRLESVEALFLATLLHDIGKPMGAGHAANGARMASMIAVSLEMAEPDVAMVDFLVRQHLTMSHISQRRDLSDPDVISKFASLVGSTPALTCLYLLTRCDTAMTAPGNLSSWKDQLLSELYNRTLDELEGGNSMESEQALHRRQARRRAVEIVSEQGREPVRAARADAIVDKLEPGFVNALTARQLSRLIECALARVDEETQVAVGVRMLAGRGQTEFVCVCEDAPAVLSHITGVLAAHRVVIDGASIASLKSSHGPIALQAFMVRDEFQQPIPADAKRWSRIERDLRLVMASTNRAEMVEELLGSRNENYSVKPKISVRDDSQIKIFDAESSDYSVIEVHTSDAIALLHCITGVLSRHGLDIHRSMVSTEGDRVADVFYVQVGGDKLSRVEGTALRTDLLAALDALE